MTSSQIKALMLTAYYEAAFSGVPFSEWSPVVSIGFSDELFV
jgi:hypothetical protein